MNLTAVIGKNFGDEGKGLAVDWLSAQAERAGESCLVVRHNGGGQAGHTVDLKKGRFVFHQLSSGSFRGADTFWADRFLPDLYKLREEVESFRAACGRDFWIYATGSCRCICIDDVLLNMALEDFRGANRHGSCGMGINEGTVRSETPAFRITLGEVCGSSADAVYRRLSEIRREYLSVRLEELGLKREYLGEYGDMLGDANVLYNAAEEMCRGADLVTLAEGQLATTYDNVVFEGAQGLLLDEEYLAYAPHLTSSRTGCTNPAAFTEKFLPNEILDLLYVSRSYVTRHGAGPLPNEELWRKWGFTLRDLTNQPNPWQGQLRFAPHGTAEDFVSAVRDDMNAIRQTGMVSLLLTHLNETQGAVCTSEGLFAPREWMAKWECEEIFGRRFASFDPYAEGIVQF